MPKTKTLASWLGGQLMAFFFCVVFPGMVTAVAPVSWVVFQRDADIISANSKTCLLFFVPYLDKSVSPVVRVGDRFVRGSIERSQSREHKHRSEDEAFLVIHGENQSIEVPVTPWNIKQVTERVEKFIDDPTQKTLELFVVANWKFSIIAGGLLCTLTVLYLFGITLSIVRRLLWLAGFKNILG